MIYNTWHYATKTIKDIMQPQPSANCDGCLKLNWSVSKIYEIRKTSRIPKQRHKILTCRCRYIVSHHVMATFCGPSCKPQAFKESGFEQQMIILYSYIHIFMYIHIFICIRYRMNMENKWTNERRQETTNGIRICIGKHGKHLQNVRPHEKDDSDDLSHPISSSTRLQKRRNRMKQAECDECIWMCNLWTKTKASRRSRRFLLVVRIKVQPTQQEAEDANLRVSFWLVLTLPNVHRNFNRTLIRIA